MTTSSPRKRLPIGIQTFAKIREDDHYYVDKTGFALRLIAQGSHYFLSRPRRFGKSLKNSFPGIAAILLVILVLATPLPAWADQRPDALVLYINSYHRGYKWSDDIERGLGEGLAASGKSIEISYEYLDSRRFAFGRQMDVIAEAMATKYADYRPDVIVVSDNAAFDFAIKYRARLFPDQPIVFCGYNLFRLEVLTGIANITGVNEEMSMEGTIDLALRVHPRTSTLVFIISTGDITNKRIGEIAEASVFPKYRERFELVILKDASLAEVRRRLTQLAPATLVFLSGQVTDSAGGRALTPVENGPLISGVSPFPAYTFWDFHLNTGVLGGHVLTGQDQGRTAADLVRQILDGRPANAIPVIMTSPASDLFDYRVMQRFGIKPSALPAHATMLNRPFSLWDAYRWFIIGGIALFAVETLLISLLLGSMRARRKALRSLDTERATLERRVAERTHELALANEQLTRLSITDGLTQLANRRRFDEILGAEFRRLQRSEAPLSLILLDIDFFKPYNDQYGHVAGDECLRRIGTLLGDMAGRAPDLAARYGGEEFALILPETDTRGAQERAERIRRGIAELAISHAASSIADHVTASLGVVTLVPTTVESPTAVIGLADEQLYRAKAEGRNRVAVAPLEHRHACQSVQQDQADNHQ